MPLKKHVNQHYGLSLCDFSSKIRTLHRIFKNSKFKVEMKKLCPTQEAVFFHSDVKHLMLRNMPSLAV